MIETQEQVADRHGRMHHGSRVHRRRLSLLTLAVAAVLSVGGTASNLCLADVSRAEDVVEGEAVRITRDAEFQQLLDRVSSAKTRDEFETRVIPLRRAAEKDWQQFFAQLLLRYEAHLEADGEVTSKTFAGRVLAELKPAHSAAVEALAPQLDNEEPVIAAFASELLRSYEDKRVAREADFTGYRGIVEADYRAGRATRASLIRRMYASDAGLAMKTLMRAYQVRDAEELRAILLGERDIERVLWKRQYGIDVSEEELKAATDAMESFAGHARWWVRMYVAKMGHAHPDLAPAPSMEKLTHDRHWLVRETAQGK
ncbi:MAG: hypothetical protein H6819_04055 [Phycisphaerales bacterium]|nr:hypothetical protein [Phycisphaerales bacterium]MCB9856372.1 hypothetical protein [Phycisphaerales bacterium]MCB9864044.1 hypothetical protein [Phycisphaerales bacterium]